MKNKSRTIDAMTKFRRTKGRCRSGAEGIYLSSSSLVYLKLLAIWLTCIALDVLVGFRFELLWPLWLLMRHLYELFRIPAFSSSLHCSAFSVFFVCVTATSDLVCYLFIPIQVLIFWGSVWVWVQFVYQSTERGICAPTIFLWVLFITFEYAIRYRFDNTVAWYLSRTSGLLPSATENSSVGGINRAGTLNSLQSRFELPGPFAAHSLGFPVIMFGFRMKSFFIKWRLKARRDEVRRQNEFFEKLLADASPTSYEDRKLFLSTSRTNNATSEQQDTNMIDYDYGIVYSPNNSASISSDHFVIATSPAPISQFDQQYSTSNAAQASTIQSIDYGGITAQTEFQKNQNVIDHQRCRTENSFHIQGQKVDWRNAITVAKRSNDVLIVAPYSKQPNRPIFRSILALCEYIPHLLLLATENIKLWLHGIGTSQQQQEDMLSSSGDGCSHLADEESDQEIPANSDGINSGIGTNVFNSNIGSSKKKMRKSRSSKQSNISGIQTSMSTKSMNGTIVSTSTINDINHGHDTEIANKFAYTEQLIIERSNELKLLYKEKQMYEQLSEKLKGELKNSRNSEVELRSQLSYTTQQERMCRTTIKQMERDMKSKVEQIEQKCRQLSKQNDHLKSQITALEKRVGELQLKKLEIERELANERLNLTKQNSREVCRQEEQLKNRHNNMDRELKTLRRDMKLKEECCTKLDYEIRQLQASKSEDAKQIEYLRQKNVLLEQTLSSENRLKQDLFRALNDSKAEIAVLTASLREKDLSSCDLGANNCQHNQTHYYHQRESPSAQNSLPSFPTQHSSTTGTETINTGLVTVDQLMTFPLGLGPLGPMSNANASPNDVSEGQFSLISGHNLSNDIFCCNNTSSFICTKKNI